MQPDFVFSSESVTAGHPDKVCDQISDAIVDRFLRQDPLARVNAECAVSTSILFLSVKARSDNVGIVCPPSGLTNSNATPSKGLPGPSLRHCSFS